jgi:TOMM propeptide domain
MNEQSNQYQQLIAKCWADEAFKQKLMADPAGTLAAEGMTVPEGVTVRVAENTAQDFTLVIPAKPTDLSDDAVSGVSGGGFSEPTYYLTRNSYICA